ncbi:Class I histocompatibility antigen, B alpha chain [Anabarilius grahami]|uniref:Class I histocompatibility antigen, B alpha chain n=1 Tax=Anabarilius grahami TaxID=495550 RepID=A0A3N0XPT8_ANAGA|nr:Class I histocompatibility antigen, B alpha chain [Anabarilius grahami]
MHLRHVTAVIRLLEPIRGHSSQCLCLHQPHRSTFQKLPKSSSPRCFTKEKHFLHYKFTVLTKADIFPEFSAVVVADGRRIKHFSDEERVWIKDDDWTEPPKDPPDSSKWFIRQIRTLSNCTNSQCSELHVLQRIIGCELEKLPDGTVNLTVFDEYGFDGEDFISFNSDTMKWIDKNPKAKETKEEWDHQTGRNQFLKYFLKNCIDWISVFNNTNKSSPDVRVSVRKAPDDDSKLVLTCLATGFYPRDVQMNIIRSYRTKLKCQTSSGIRPNDDETFQMRISVKINRNLKGSYYCLLIHSSLRKPVSVKWEKHFLHYKFTALSKANTFPEFSAEVVADDRQIKHFSDEERVWILTEDDWTEPPDPPDSRDWFIHQIRTLTNCENSQCSELHVLQRIIGCELEKLPDGTVNLTVFDEYGFDGEDFISFDSDTMQWIDKNPKAKETKTIWDLQTGRNQFIKYFLKNCIDWISTFNNTKQKLHVLQRIIGCELEKLPDGTVILTVFDEYGFDGEDFISFNSDTMQWIDKNPKAKETKEKWDLQTGRNHFLKYFLKNCMNWISIFNNTKQSKPNIHTFVKKVHNDDSKLVLTCLATGFYPSDVQMNIRLYRINLEDQTSSGIRPNDDETFQMRISVKINRNHEGSYDCLLIHSSLTEPVSVKWDGKCSGCETDFTLIVIPGVIEAADWDDPRGVTWSKVSCSRTAEIEPATFCLPVQWFSPLHLNIYKATVQLCPTHVLPLLLQGCGVQGFIIMFFLILWINVVHIEEREIVKHRAAHNNLRHKDMLTSGREETEQQRVFRMPKALSVL